MFFWYYILIFGGCCVAKIIDNWRCFMPPWHSLTDSGSTPAMVSTPVSHLIKSRQCRRPFTPWLHLAPSLVDFEMVQKRLFICKWKCTENLVMITVYHVLTLFLFVLCVECFSQKYTCRFFCHSLFWCFHDVSWAMGKACNVWKISPNNSQIFFVRPLGICSAWSGCSKMSLSPF